jgi:uncharacterized protein
VQIQSPLIYPLKSARGLSLDHAEVQVRGLAHDRRWMVVDALGRFVTARKFPVMVTIDATIDAQKRTLTLQAPDQPSIRIAEPDVSEPRIEVEVWKSHCPARAASEAANTWISALIGSDCRLVHMADDCIRTVSQTWSQPGDIVSFADGFPLLLIGTASLAELNRRLKNPVTMAHFRPNLIVETQTAFIEDTWKRVRIGAIEFDVSKPCTRCILTTIDPGTGIKAADGEPLATLKTYRQFDIGVTFGQNLIPRGLGILRKDDAFTPLA